MTNKTYDVTAIMLGNHSMRSFKKLSETAVPNNAPRTTRLIKRSQLGIQIFCPNMEAKVVVNKAPSNQGKGNVIETNITEPINPMISVVNK